MPVSGLTAGEEGARHLAHWHLRIRVAYLGQHPNCSVFGLTASAVSLYHHCFVDLYGVVVALRVFEAITWTHGWHVLKEPLRALAAS
jgi:hypothetical protein